MEGLGGPIGLCVDPRNTAWTPAHSHQPAINLPAHTGTHTPPRWQSGLYSGLATGPIFNPELPGQRAKAGKRDSSPRSEQPAPRWPSHLIPQSQPVLPVPSPRPIDPWPLGFAFTPSTGKRASFLCRGLGRRPPRDAVIETGSGLYRLRDRLDPCLSQSMRRPRKAHGSSSPVKGPDRVGIVWRFPDLRFSDQMVLLPGSHAGL